MLYDYQFSNVIADSRRQDLMTAARINRLRKATRTRNVRTRPQRRWLGFGPRPASRSAQPAKNTCPAAA
jgi:hypothetical protein